MKKPKYKAGDEVYWNDPDDGLCSAYYIVVDYNPGCEVYTLKNEASETEAFEHELE